MTASLGGRTLVSALAGALLLAALSTLGDFVWANWRVRHLMLYGVLHGMAIFLAIGLFLGGRAGAPLLGGIAGIVAGAGAAGSFYLLAPVMGYSAMFVSWVLVWIALGFISLWLSRRGGARRTGAGSMSGRSGSLLTEGLGRGVVAALASGAAFYAVSGMWFPFDPAGWDYAVHFASWTVAFLPGRSAYTGAGGTTAMQRPVLRLWPGIAGAAVVIVGLLVTAALPVAADYSLIGTGVGVFAITLWWLFFSRAPWLERVGALVLMVVAVAAVRPFIHASVAGGAQGGLQYILSMLPISLLLVAWAAGTRHLSPTARRASMAVAILAGGASIALLRTDGIGGAAMFQLRWRWTPTAEERLLAEVKDDPIAPPARPEPIPEPVAPVGTAPENADPTLTAVTEAAVPVRKPAEWPGFRGPARDGAVPGVKIVSDWSASPPTELWRRRIGPGWSSFAVDGDLIYTQEQRGDDEIVACYRLSTGEPVWRHRDAARFYESNGGAGPRGTPALSNGVVYAFGATGVLNALDARTGAVRWSRNAAADTKEDTPVWGFSSSPLIVADEVVVATAGTLAGYDVATGTPRWVGSAHGFSYSSPHLVTIDGVAQVLLLAPPGVFSVAPSDGAMLWEHTWEGGGIVQPAVTPDGDILVSGVAGTGGSGVRRLAVHREGGTWTVQERWTSNGLKPYFNDYVVHNGYAFGFDGSILSSIDLADGTRKWKGGRYGAGQLVLLPDQDLLLVLSEEGGLALVSATPDKFTEIARAPAIEGKTWNHPVLVGDVLLVRNGEEMAAFRLALAP